VQQSSSTVAQFLIACHKHNLRYSFPMQHHEQTKPISDPALSWSQLRAFEACARLLSFTAAALSLSVTASAVRLQIGLLEARLGVVLFDRNGGRLALTAIGQTFAASIERPLHDLLAACATASRSAQTAPLTLSAPPLFARQFLLESEFLKWCERNNVLLDVSDAKRDLFGPTLIAAIRLGARSDADLKLVPLFKVTLCIAAAPLLAAKARPADTEWWNQQTLLTPSAAASGWLAAWQSLRVNLPTEPRIVPYASYAAALEAACAGAGIILAPVPFANRELIDGRLREIAPLSIASGSGYSLVMRDDLATSLRGKALARKLKTLCKG
jgi:LysR family transcriptional regulator, glycine cleavage system transcriptional activator